MVNFDIHSSVYRRFGVRVIERALEACYTHVSDVADEQVIGENARPGTLPTWTQIVQDVHQQICNARLIATFYEYIDVTR